MEINASNIKIFFRCSGDLQCGAYEYSRTGQRNCVLIHRNSTAEDGLTFSTNGQKDLYKKGMYNSIKSCFLN